MSTIVNIPFSLYSTFVVEQRHGFNKQTIGLFFTDMLKQLAVGGVIMIPFLAAFLWIIKSTGNQFYFYVWLTVYVYSIGNSRNATSQKRAN